MKCLIVFLCVFLFVECQDEVREPKFFFGSKAHTVVTFRQVPEFVTEFVPSSCIVIDPTLQPCRHVRNFKIHPSAPTRITTTRGPDHPNFNANNLNLWNKMPQPSENINKAPTPPLRVNMPHRIKTHSPYWNWHFLNPFRVQNVTYTETKTEYVTTKVEDPHTVVSFYIRGCRPSRLPFNLSECDKPLEYFPEPIKAEETKADENKSIVIMAPLKFVATVEEAITPSKSLTTTEADDLKNQGFEQQVTTGENANVSGEGEEESSEEANTGAKQQEPETEGETTTEEAT